MCLHCKCNYILILWIHHFFWCFNQSRYISNTYVVDLDVWNWRFVTHGTDFVCKMIYAWSRCAKQIWIKKPRWQRAWLYLCINFPVYLFQSSLCAALLLGKSLRALQQRLGSNEQILQVIDHVVSLLVDDFLYFILFIISYCNLLPSELELCGQKHTTDVDKVDFWLIMEMILWLSLESIYQNILLQWNLSVTTTSLYNNIYFLWFIQQCVLMKTEGTNLFLITISAFWS